MCRVNEAQKTRFQNAKDRDISLASTKAWMVPKHGVGLAYL
jgi:hypothetical protein